VEVDGLAMNQVIPPNIQTLLIRKQTADSLPPEIRSKYAEEYQLLISQIANYGLDHSLPAWDTEVNMEILSITLREIAGKYGHNGVDRMCSEMVPDVDVSFRERDRVRFGRLVRVARERMENA